MSSDFPVKHMTSSHHNNIYHDAMQGVPLQSQLYTIWIFNLKIYKLLDQHKTRSAINQIWLGNDSRDHIPPPELTDY